MSRLSTDEIAGLKILSRIKKLGEVRIHKLLAKFHSIDAIFDADETLLKNTDSIGTETVKSIKSAVKFRDEAINEILKEQEELEKLDGRIVTFLDDEYPFLLKNIYSPPLIIYVKGTLKKDDEKSLAIVGTRNPTETGIINSERFSSAAAAKGLTIISGLAMGIDAAAHRAALKAGGRTIAVMGTGLNLIYPRSNCRLADEITENGALITEFPLGTSPEAFNFPRRNRIISGLSLGTLVVESASKGGALITARMALDQNREVFAIPGSISVSQYNGTNALIQKGEAKLIQQPDDIFNELNVKLDKEKNEAAQKPNLNMFEEKIYNAIEDEPLHIDKIAALSGISTTDCLVYILSLEFKGLIKQLPGKMFVKV